MEAEVRPISGDAEARAVQRVGRRAFHPVLGLIVTKPKWGFAAWDGDTCLGGVILGSHGQFGIVEFIFISKDGRGKGLGKRLTDHAMEAFAERGLKYSAASVRDDNTASWNLFAGRGHTAYTPLRIIRDFGFGTWLSLSLTTAQLFAFGFDLWIGSVEQARTPNADSRLQVSDTAPGSSVATLVLFFLIHMVAVTAAFWQDGAGPGPWAIAIAALLTVRLLFSYLATVPFFRPARIRMARGGAITDFIINAIGSFFFYPVFWHPRVTRWREPDYRAGLGVSAMIGALSVIVLLAAGSLILGAGVLQSALLVRAIAIMIDLGKLMLIIDLQPLFEAWSGPRIIRWNLWAYLITATAAVAVIIWA
jgi:GNAT superfamily N-acetyltransferase